jgi:hypothetical protein
VRWTLVLLLFATVALSACGGGGSDDEPIAGEEVVAAFEDAAGGYEFEETTSLVDGAAAYAPRNESDPAAVEPLNEALGESSLLWQVLVFEGSDPPLDEEAAEEAAFASSKLKQEGEGVYLGDNDTAYVVNGNVVAIGPVLDGDTDDETLKRWQAVLDEL